MQRSIRAAAVAVMVASASYAILADATPQSQSGEIQLQLGNTFFADGRYQDALEAFKQALAATVPADARAARSGLIQAALRMAEFDLARTEAARLVESAPADPEAAAIYGDALWAAGLFEEAEGQYRAAVKITPDLARGRHGIARGLAARSKLDEAINEAQAALRLSPRDVELHHTVGSIYERMHKFEEAASAYTNYVNLLPNNDTSDKAAWSRSEIKFLRSFGQSVPFQMDPGAEDKIYTLDFKLVNDKVMVRAKVNDGSFTDFIVDTGSETTVISGPVARRLGITPVTYTLSAGIGNIGLRGLQLARIDSLELGPLKLRNVPVLIKDPLLRDIPVKETESLSPLALGFSMIIDYKTKKITFGRHLPEEPSDFELPLRVYRLATVRGTVDKHPTNFVVDTGGEVISISTATATSLNRPEPARRIALKVFGASGWDEDAFLMQGVDIAFNEIQYTNSPVVVLNLTAPSALLGYKLGGIVGHRFLSRYRVGIDLEKSVLRLKKN
jgi:tetratricopeptide (TPR) repeat protein